MQLLQAACEACRVSARHRLMRVHRLEVTAFGPFAGTEVMDFDALKSGGVFLLTGQTGAGKTSILDAICFAFFGAVPGARNSAKSFKSHHAKDDVAPSVVLEVTLRDRRLRLRRSPAWQRPSSRAKAGFVEQPAKASVEELTDGQWITHSTRADEVGLFVSRLMGMNKDQFCQVVMLPQGQFQTFLRAGAKDRHDVLESLFDTQRFAEVERWLVDRRRALDVRCRDSEAGIDQLLARAHEVGAIRHPEPSPGAEAGTASMVPPSYADLICELEAQAVELRARAAKAHDDAQLTAVAAKQCQHALDTARGLADRQLRHREALNRIGALESTREVVQAREQRVDLARKATTFAPLLRLVEEADDALSAAEAAVTGCLSHVFATPPTAPPTVADIRKRAGAFREEVTRLTTLQGVERELDDSERRLSELDDEIRGDTALTEKLVAKLDKLATQIEALDRRLVDANSASTLLTAARDGVAEATRVHEAAQEAVVLRDKLAAAETQQLTAREQRADAREQWQDLRERYVSGMAAVLAADLADTDPCPVCGSSDHPSLAAPSDDQVSREDESAALDHLERIEQHLSKIDTRRERLAAELQAACARAGDRTIETAKTDLDRALATLAELTQLADQLPSLTRQREQGQRSRDELSKQRERLDQTMRSTLAERTTVVTIAGRHRAEIESAVGPGVRLDVRLAELVEQTERADALLEACTRRDLAVASQRAAVDRLMQLVADSTFATVAEVRAALLTDTEIANDDALNRAYAAELTAASRLVREPALVEAAALDEPDLEQLLLSAEQAAAAHTAASTVAASLESSTSRLDILVLELSTALCRHQPLVSERELVDQVATMCAGTSKDNTTKTKLSHYVLGARLQQVVEAANVRLAGICGGRFQLEHTLTRGVGDARGGLGLRVIDTYTDQWRDPATLSGGETFYVSLALALGLGDLVNNEIGGAELSTLFVDEGFGSLDAETLDEVMDELDALRSGGRTVGLVSHLSELRMRIPAQLSVVRTPRGSHLDDSR